MGGVAFCAVHRWLSTRTYPGQHEDRGRKGKDRRRSSAGSASHAEQNKMCKRDSRQSLARDKAGPAHRERETPTPPLNGIHRMGRGGDTSVHRSDKSWTATEPSTIFSSVRGVDYLFFPQYTARRSQCHHVRFVSTAQLHKLPCGLRPGIKSPAAPRTVSRSTAAESHLRTLHQPLRNVFRRHPGAEHELEPHL